MTDTYVTAATQYIDAEGTRYAYRRFGRETGVPLILFQNFRQGMDNVDPLLLDGFARDRPVILSDNAGVASSSGETPDTIEAMADQAAAFVGALKLTELDVLGFSIGGYSAQAFVLRHPHLVRRLMLLGTAPRAQEPRTDPHVDQVVSRPFSVSVWRNTFSFCSRRHRLPKPPVGMLGIDNKPPGNSDVSAGWISTLRPRRRPQRLNTRQSSSGVRPKGSVSRSSRRSSSPRSS